MHYESIRDDGLKGLGAEERRVLSALAALERPTVTAQDAIDRVGLNRQAANLMLSRLSKKGWLHRLRRGVHAVLPVSSASATPVVEDPLAVAADLFEPCYISGWTAAEYWGMTEQIHNVVVIYSAKPQRQSRMTIGGVQYRVRRVEPDAIFGTTKVWHGRVAIPMATVHRTLVDVADAPDMGGGARQTADFVRAYWQRQDADAEVLYELATRLGRGSVFKRLGFLGETLGRLNEPWTERFRESMTEGIALLDPAGKNEGPIVTRWRLRVNIPLDDLS